MVKQSHDQMTKGKPVPLLLTRPQIQSFRTATELLALHTDRIQPVISPLLVPEFFGVNIPRQTYTATIFTSETAVAAAAMPGSIGETLAICAYCVGQQTARAAQLAGFDAISADGDAEALIRLIRERRDSGPLLHLHGQETRGDIGRRLNDLGIETVSRVVYRQVAQPFSSDALGLFQKPGSIIVPLYSPRTARLFYEALPQDVRAKLHVVAISAAVAAAASPLNAATTAKAATSDAKAMIGAISKLVISLYGS